MSTEKMREEFQEAYAEYCAERGWKTYTAFHMLSEVYVKDSTELAWNMWKASRESLVIELPDRLKAEQAGAFQSQESVNAYVSGFNRAMASAQKAIEDTGLKVAK